MNVISAGEFRNFCSRNGISIEDPRLGIGKDLHFDPARTVVITVLKTDTKEYLSDIIKILLSLENAWFLVPRYDHSAPWGPLDKTENEILSIEASDFDNLLVFLHKHFKERLFKMDDDVYLVSNTGNILIDFSHHFLNEGLGIYLKDKNLTGQLLLKLNELGSEIELFSADRGRDISLHS